VGEHHIGSQALFQPVSKGPKKVVAMKDRKADKK
jgi:hypothetical protein